MWGPILRSPCTLNLRSHLDVNPSFLLDDNLAPALVGALQEKMNRPDWYMPNWAPKSSVIVSCLLVFSSSITSTTTGYDGSMINGLNIEPQYTDYFHLTPVTEGLMTASIYIGGTIAGLGWYGRVTDKIGRRPAQFWAALLTLLAVIMQTAAKNPATFIVARILIGLGTSASGLSGPTYLAETLPSEWRAWGLGIFNDFYYVGGLMAAGITYGSQNIQGSWAWRAPSLVQGLFSLICILVLPFIPESPRWLVYQGRTEEARKVLALTHSDGDESNPVVETQFKQIVDALEYERTKGQSLSFKEMVKTRTARKRLQLVIMTAVFSTIAGNVAASYYLGPMLYNAGITDITTQLGINVVINAFCLICSIAGTYSCDKWGRKPTVLTSTISLTGFIFMMGALTKVYGLSTYHPGIYASVASICLFQGSYSFGWTPILYLYPPEILNYPMRANGMSVFQTFLNGTALIFVFIMPIALDTIGWKIYFINGAWDVLMIAAIVYFWVETKGKTLEEIDEVFEGERRRITSSIGDMDEMARKTDDKVADLK